MMTKETGLRWGTTTHRDEHGVQREYNMVYRVANVGDMVKVVQGSYTGQVHTVTSVNQWGAVCNRFGASPALTHNAYAVLEPTDIVVHNGKRYKTVKRKANVGDIVLIVSDMDKDHGLDVGSVHIVDEFESETGDGNSRADGLQEVRVECGLWLWHRDYVVLEPADTELSLDDIVRDLKRVCADYRTLAGRVDALEARRDRMVVLF